MCVEKNNSISRANFLIFILLVCLSLFLLIGINSDQGFTRLSTEAEQINFALKFGTGDFNPHRFLHPPLLAYILFFVYGASFVLGKIFGFFQSIEDFKILFFIKPVFFFFIARLFIIFLTSVSVILTYKLSKRTLSRTEGIISILLLVFFPSYIKLAHFATGDFLLLILGLISFHFILNIYEKGRAKDYILAGLFIGLSVSAKYNGVVLFLPLIFASLLSKRKILGEVKKIFLSGIFVMLGFFIGCPFAFLDSTFFYNQIITQFSRMRSGTYHFSSWKADKIGWLYILFDTLPFAIGALFSILLIAALINSFFQKNRKLLIMSLFITCYLAYTGTWTLIKPRYYLFLFPYFSILITNLLFEIKDKINLKNIVCLFILFIFAVPNLINIVNFKRCVVKTPIKLEAKKWIETNVEPDSKIALFLGIPLVPNEESINSRLEKIHKRGYGQGKRLALMKSYLDYFPKKYYVRKLSLPWMEDFDIEDYDFNSLIKDGFTYFVVTQEIMEYLSKPHKYPVQSKFVKELQGNSMLVKSFIGERFELEPEFLVNYECILIYKIKTKKKEFL